MSHLAQETPRLTCFFCSSFNIMLIAGVHYCVGLCESQNWFWGRTSHDRWTLLRAGLFGLLGSSQPAGGFAV